MRVAKYESPYESLSVDSNTVDLLFETLERTRETGVSSCRYSRVKSHRTPGERTDGGETLRRNRSPLFRTINRGRRPSLAESTCINVRVRSGHDPRGEIRRHSRTGRGMHAPRRRGSEPSVPRGRGINVVFTGAPRCSAL